MAAVLGLVVAGCSDAGTTPATEPPVETEDCVTFDDLTAGAEYAPADRFSSNGVQIQVGDFYFDGAALPDPTPAFVQQRTDGAGKQMFVPNVTLTLELPPAPYGWSVRFIDYDGRVNLAVDGHNVMSDAEDLEDWNGGAAFPGTVIAADGGLDGSFGELQVIREGITTLTIGGQQFVIDDVCPLAELPVTAPPTTRPPATGPLPTGQAPAGPGCITFDDMTRHDQFVPGQAFVSDGVTIRVGVFYRGGAPIDPVAANIDDGGWAGGVGNELGVNKVAVEFDLPPAAGGWSVLFGEYGGHVNLAVNGDNFGSDADDFDEWDGASFGGATVTAAGGSDAGGGELLISGAGVETLTIGGQELWIDNVCPRS